MRPWRIPVCYFKRKPYRLSTAVKQVTSFSLKGARAFFTRRPSQESVIFLIAEPRCGTEFFCDCLASTGEVSVRGEVLNPWAPNGLPPTLISRRVVLAHLAASTQAPRKYVIIKLMLHHLDWKHIALDQVIHHFGRAKYILLYRGDLLKQYISSQILIETGQHRISCESQRHPYRLTVNADEFRQFAEHMRSAFDGAATALRKTRADCRLVRFEQLVQEPQVLFDETILPFLGIASRQIQSRTVRQNVNTISETVRNWTDIAPKVSEHRFLRLKTGHFVLGTDAE